MLPYQWVTEFIIVLCTSRSSLFTGTYRFYQLGAAFEIFSFKIGQFSQCACMLNTGSFHRFRLVLQVVWTSINLCDIESWWFTLYVTGRIHSNKPVPWEKRRNENSLFSGSLRIDSPHQTANRKSVKIQKNTSFWKIPNIVQTYAR